MSKLQENFMRGKQMEFAKHRLKFFPVAMLFFIATCAGGSLHAQKIAASIRGLIENAKGERIDRASVVLKNNPAGLSLSTVSNEQGIFSFSGLNPTGPYEITISYVGYETQVLNRAKLNPGKEESILITLQLSSSPANDLKEIVVTGYTAQRKKDITGSVSVVNVKDLTTTPGPNVESLLQGNAAGVTVGTSGDPGGSAMVRIHGFGTFYQNDPLFIVDGTRVSSITDINPNDIASMSVLKDASSAAVYGSTAANGVIVITTKKGTGKTKVSYRGYYGSQSFNKGLDLLNTAQYGDYLYALAKGGNQLGNDGKFMHPQYGGPTGSSDQPIIPEDILAGSKTGLAAGDPAADPSMYNLDLANVNGASTYLIVKANRQGTDWLKQITNTAPIINNELTVSGGNGGNNYFLSLNHFDQKGTIDFTGYKSYSLRANTNLVVKKNIRIGENLQISTIRRQVGLNEGSAEDNNTILMATRIQPIIPVYDIAGNFAGTRGSGLGNAKNPYAALYRNKDDKNARVSAVGSLYAEVNFLRYFKFKSSLGINYGTNSVYAFDPVTYENSEGRGGFASFNESQSYGYSLTWFNTVNYERVFNKVHAVNAMIGTEIVQERGRSISAQNSNYFLDDRNFWQAGSGLNTTPFGTSSEYSGNKYSPVIAKVDYAYDDRYLLSVSYRRDGSSNVFGPNNKYGDFGAASAGWRISNESFLKESKWLNDLKLRASYGILGNDKIPGFGFLTSYTYGNLKASYPIDGSNTGFEPGLFTKTIGNPDIRWEQSATATLGLDATIFNKLEVSVDLYKRKTTNMLYLRQLDPNIYGVVDLQPTNVGDMMNKGVDLNLTYRGNSGNFKYNAGLNFSLYKNTVGDISDPYLEGTSSRIGAFNRSVTGMPISSFYGYIVDGFFQNENDLAALEQTNEGIGKWKYKDINHDGKITPDDRTFIGNPHPKFIMGSNLNASWKNWDATVFLYWKCGGQIANYMRYFTDFNTLEGNRSERVLYDSWTPEHTDAKLPVLDGSDAISGNQPSSYYIEPGGYLRLKTLSIGYSLPVKVLGSIGIDRLRLYVQAQNLFTITKYTGLDPEISIMNNGIQDYKTGFVDSNLGVDKGNYPTPKTILFGLEVNF